jgi:hypothetical protein
MIGGAIERIAERANADAWLVHRGRYLDVTFLLDVGSSPYLVRINRGRVDAIDKGPMVLPRWTFALRASLEDWRTFWSAQPPPGCHDLIAMLRFKRLRIDGDPLPFMANLRYFKELLALPRATTRAGP